MRRTLVAIAALFTIVSGTAAQRTQGGIVAGMTINTLVDTEGAESRTTPVFGLQLVFHGTSTIGFETGAFYVSKGASQDFEGAEAALKFNYIEIPALLRFAIPIQGSAIRPVFAVGGSLGIKSGCKLEVSEGGTSFEANCEDPDFEGDGLELKSIDFGLSAGASVDIPAGERFIIAPGVRYTRGLSEVSDAVEAEGSKNSSIEIKVAVRMRF